MRVWRICRQVHAASAFSGEGARLFSGRWNPAGVPMVYSSLSLALATLEVFVHLEPLLAPRDLVSITAELPVEVEQVERIDPSSLPSDWRRIGHPELASIGAAWIQSGRSLVLLVPSVVVPGEWNALINPAHPDAGTIRVGVVAPFEFDSRMFR